MKKNILLLAFLLGLIFVCCEPTETFPEKKPINENIVALPNSEHLNNALWINDSTLFYSVGYYTITDNFKSIADKILIRKFYDNYIMQDYMDDKILWTRRYYAPDVGSSVALNEYSLATGEQTTICEDRLITGAKYYRDSKYIIYHAYANIGTSQQRLSAFYLYDRENNTKKVLLSDTTDSYSVAFSNVKGFDIHPEKNILLTLGNNYNLIEYNIDSRQVDTLSVSFPPVNNKKFLWLRYDNSGNHVVYSHYYYIPDSEWGESEIGILNMQTNEKQVLDVNTNTRGTSVNIFPSWSPDNKHIVYGSGSVYIHMKTTPKSLMPELFVLKNVNH